MRIAHVTSGLDRQAAGVGAVVAALSAAEQAAGHEVRVFGLSSDAWESGDKALWQGAPALAFRVRGKPQAFGYAPDLGSALAAFAPDIVHLHGLWMYPGLAVLNWHRKTGRPYVLSVHGMLASSALKFGRWKKAIVRRLFQDRALAHAARLHATTATEAEEIRAYGLSGPVSVVPLGIHPAPQPDSVPADLAARKVLFLGRLHPIKGLDRLVTAWASLEPRFPDWRLDLVGPDELGHAEELRRLATTLSVQRLSIRPPLYGADRDRCLAAASIFVLPTRSENFALTVAESLMMQTPVIATTGAPWPGLQDHDCGWWIDQGVAPLIEALEAAMSLSDTERARMGRNGRAWMLRDYSWDSVAARMIDVYRECLDDASFPRSGSTGQDWTHANRASRKWTPREQIGRVLWGLAWPLFRLSPRVFWGWRRLLLRVFGASVGRGVHVYPSVRITIPWNLDLGENCAVGDRAILYALGPITIGARATISQGAHLCAGTHDLTDPSRPLLKPPIQVGDDAWICADAFVGPGVRVGRGAIVGARAVTVRDVAEETTVVGNPARVIQRKS